MLVVNYNKTIASLYCMS